jgi:hypothetical protein
MMLSKGGLGPPPMHGVLIMRTVEIDSMFLHRFFVLIGGALLSSCAFTQPDPTPTTTICQLAESSAAMNGHIVRVRAIYITDLKHITILKDRQCKSVSLSILDAEKNKRDPSMEDFDRAVWGKIDDLDLRVFSVDASGIFMRQPQSTPRDALSIQKIWHFERLDSGDWKFPE